LERWRGCWGPRRSNSEVNRFGLQGRAPPREIFGLPSLTKVTLGGAFLEGEQVLGGGGPAGPPCQMVICQGEVGLFGSVRGMWRCFDACVGLPLHAGWFYCSWPSCGGGLGGCVLWLVCGFSPLCVSVGRTLCFCWSRLLFWLAGAPCYLVFCFYVVYFVFMFFSLFKFVFMLHMDMMRCADGASSISPSELCRPPEAVLWLWCGRSFEDSFLGRE
jgi:hypothetical protein